MYTYYVFVNVTLSVPDELLARARAIARRQGKSLNDLVRRFLEQVAGLVLGEKVVEDLLEEFSRHGGRSKGRRIRREDAYTDRV